jgi:hypothetical protein
VDTRCSFQKARPQRLRSIQVMGSEDEEDLPPTSRLCSVRGCRITGEDLFRCANVSCGKYVHLACWTAIKTKHSLIAMPAPEVACTKKCCERAVAAFTSVSNWSNDAAFPEPGSETVHRSSESILIEWLSVEKNYARYRGDAGGLTKQDVCEEISKLIEHAGCRGAVFPVPETSSIRRSFKLRNHSKWRETGQRQKQVKVSKVRMKDRTRMS